MFEHYSVNNIINFNLRSTKQQIIKYEKIIPYSYTRFIFFNHI